MDIFLDKLKESDFEDLFYFELNNKEYFELFVPSRPSDYYIYKSFIKIMKELLYEETLGISKFYLVKNKEDVIVGRINLTDIDNQSAELGYRIGKEFTGYAIASKALNLLLENLDLINISIVNSKTTISNIGSQKVMLKNNFAFIKEDIEEFYFNNKLERFVHFQFKK